MTIPTSELDVKLADRLDQLKDRVCRSRASGPGKVPVTHLRRIYGKAAMAEIVESTVGEIDAPGASPTAASAQPCSRRSP